ncbi:hypothetical protein HU830_04210 [Lactobacillus sp. DCY120]|uniref:Major facilitator superfamily (MFS) profile domain-containing protein n=1 Tax=Bombilactobacillus apium TaxID=2675299 RepID=A0A850RAJ8_9LACO|nr:hypothetical protein [Bombilactobacillus apium]NVY96376.1 hypothetical protein [Bombilactobacillus apium]
MMVQAGYGTATSASYVILALSLGAMLGRVLFGPLFQKLQNWLLPLALFLLALAMGIIVGSQRILITVFAGFLTGLAVRQFFLWILNAINRQGAGNTIQNSLILIAYNLAGVLSPYTSLILQKYFQIQDLHFLFVVNMLGFLILVILVGGILWGTRKIMKGI